MQAENEELTIELLRTYQGFQDVSDEEATAILQQLREFCLIILESAK